MAGLSDTVRSEIVYLNGEFMPRDNALISPDDRGFQFADGVYEVIKYYKGKPFCLNEHMERLERNIEAIRLRPNHSADLGEVCGRLIETNKLTDTFASVYLQVTRGVQIRMHKFPDPAVMPSVYGTALIMPLLFNEMKNGISVISRNDIRWTRCDIKSIALLPNVLMYQEAIEAGASECFFIRNGVFTEATHSNIMAIRNGTLHTHPDSGFILPGITKKIIFKLCKELHIAVREEAILASAVHEYDEFFITGTGNEIMPVIKINDLFIRDGRPGPYTRMLQRAFFSITYEALANVKTGI